MSTKGLWWRNSPDHTTYKSHEQYKSSSISWKFNVQRYIWRVLRWYYTQRFNKKANVICPSLCRIRRSWTVAEGNIIFHERYGMILVELRVNKLEGKLCGSSICVVRCQNEQMRREATRRSVVDRWLSMSWKLESYLAQDLTRRSWQGSQSRFYSTYPTVCALTSVLWLSSRLLSWTVYVIPNIRGVRGL